MATNFPTSLDSFTNPSSAQFLNSPSHSGLHDNANDALAAVQAKVGANGSAVTTSLQYKLGGVTGTDLAVSKTGVETLTNKTLTNPTIAAILVNAGANTATLFTSTDTVVGRATTDTLTNKTLTSPKVGTQILDTNGALLITVSATASAVNGISIVNSATGVDPQILPGGTDSARHLNLRGKGLAKTVTVGAGAALIFPFDFVLSGCVLSGTGYGTTLNWSLTSGVVVINGNPVTVASATGTVTASKDTYFDILDNGDGTGLLVNTAGNIVANNAASPALAANSVRIGIIVSGANIAAATSVNQGQESMLLPIVSSTPYAVTDSLGNLICPRDPSRKLLGARYVTLSQGFSGGFVDMTGMNLTVNIPTSRKAKITYSYPVGYNSVDGDGGQVNLFDATAGVQIANSSMQSAAANGLIPLGTFIIYTPPAAGVRTFKNQGGAVSAGTYNTNALTTQPCSLIVELE